MGSSSSISGAPCSAHCAARRAGARRPTTAARRDPPARWRRETRRAPPRHPRHPAHKPPASSRRCTVIGEAVVEPCCGARERARQRNVGRRPIALRSAVISTSVHAVSDGTGSPAGAQQRALARWRCGPSTEHRQRSPGRACQSSPRTGCGRRRQASVRRFRRRRRDGRLHVRHRALRTSVQKPMNSGAPTSAITAPTGSPRAASRACARRGRRRRAAPRRRPAPSTRNSRVRCTPDRRQQLRHDQADKPIAPAVATASPASEAATSEQFVAQPAHRLAKQRRGLGAEQRAIDAAPARCHAGREQRRRREGRPRRGARRTNRRRARRSRPRAKRSSG